jgi:AcrR family transcriptional regulator
VSTKRRYELKARAEKAAETRLRITEATVELHREVGPARTTVAEIARRAGVQRLTVYNHFPDERMLLGACSGHWLAQNPPPDLGPLLAVEDPARRLRDVLGALYAWYRETEPMSEKIVRDVEVMPALAEVVGLEQRDAALVGALSRGLGRSKRVRAMLSLAIGFHTWQRLARAGLSDAEAAGVMAQACAPISSPS